MENSSTIQNNSAEIIPQPAEKSQELPVNVVRAAIEKIKAEYKEFKGGRYEKAISSYVSTILQDFCKQDERFAEVVYKFKRTLSDCCKEIIKGAKSHVSDVDVYRSAVKYYFPNSEVIMQISIEITGEAPDETEILKEAEKPKPVEKKKTASKPRKTATKDMGKASAKEAKEDKKEFIQLSLL